MKKINIYYWVFTGLFAVLMLFSSVPDVLMVPGAVKFMTALGYPLYFIPFIGIAKILGVAAILIPGYPRIKEWAYAGLTFDLVGATYSIIAIGAPMSGWIVMLVWFVFLIASYMLYHKHQKMAKERTGL
jgi:hypothetical protein